MAAPAEVDGREGGHEEPQHVWVMGAQFGWCTVGTTRRLRSAPGDVGQNPGVAARRARTPPEAPPMAQRPTRLLACASVTGESGSMFVSPATQCAPLTRMLSVQRGTDLRRSRRRQPAQARLSRRLGG
jgi:hypothetical protein